MKKVLFLLPLFVFSCKGSKELKIEKQNIGSIMYKYLASSVPPQYHRSYKLLVSEGSIRVTVNSYATVLTDTILPISKQQFDEIVNTYDSIGFKSVPDKENKGCVGGTGALLKVWDQKDTLLFDGYISFCGGEENGNMTGDIKKLSGKIISVIPNFEELLKRDWEPALDDE
jgi:hypothetical protein